MSKILIVGLLQVVLAQNIPDARPYVRVNINTGRQFYYTAPENRNLELPSRDMRFRTEDFNNEKTAINNNEYALAKNPQSDISNGRLDNGGVNNYGRKNHRVAVHRKNGQYRTSDSLDPVYSDQGSRTNIRHVNSDQIETEYNTKDNNHTSHDQVRTNKNTSEDNGVSQPTNEYIELTTVPVLVLMSATLKTNPNIYSSSADKTSNDNAEVRHNSDAPIFAEIDNKPGSLDKTTTDNEVRYSNGADGKEKGDRWIWDGNNNANTTSTEKANTDGDLDDRISFNADGCPTGEAKVKGICTPTH